jgi:hypothetical protein
MAFRVAVAGRNAGLDAALDRANAGAGPGTVKIYTGAQPANADVSDLTGYTLLITFTLADPAFAAADAGVKDLDADPDMSANAADTGTAGWARCEDSDGNNVFDGSVGTSGTDFIITSTSIVSGQEYKLTLGSVTDPVA